MTTNDTHVWFITGASSGIGRELVRQALAAGERVAAVSRTTTALAELADNSAYADRLLVLAADVRDEDAVSAAAEQAVSRFGRLDVVANNAGYGLFGAVEEASDTEARAIFDTNVFGVLNVLRATLPILRKQQSGHVLQGSSTYGQTAHAGVGLLAASKYAVEGLTDALVEELAPLGIHVTLVQPGYTATSFFANLQASEHTTSDYDSTVRHIFQVLSALPETAFSNAERVAAGIREAVASDQPPLRLALGSAGAESMRTALNARISQLDATVAITNAVDDATAGD
jgi:NAD(P)-dependent dehydrogenase (short-subunit alcohol dehydrogenase family)